MSALGQIGVGLHKKTSPKKSNGRRMQQEYERIADENNPNSPAI
jgi:hypothetical protein